MNCQDRFLTFYLQNAVTRAIRKQAEHREDAEYQALRALSLRVSHGTHKQISQRALVVVHMIHLQKNDGNRVDSALLGLSQ